MFYESNDKPKRLKAQPMLRITLSIDRCPRHQDFWAVSINELEGDGGSGDRLTPSKCCGQWQSVRQWDMTPNDLRRMIGVCEGAISSLENLPAPVAIAKAEGR